MLWQWQIFSRNKVIVFRLFKDVLFLWWFIYNLLFTSLFSLDDIG